MKRRAPGPIALLLGALLAACGPEGPPPPPSIVIVTVDTLRADHLGVYGYARGTSPVIDAFADEAVVFDRAYAPMATTLPSHVTLMTSLSPVQHGVLGNFHQLGESLETSDSIVTAAQMLGRHGYTTAAFVSATPLKEHSGIQAGFEQWDQPKRRDRRAAVTTGAVLDWLEEERPSGPVFLWVHYFDPHSPYEPPAPFMSMFDPDDTLRGFLEEQGTTRLTPRVLFDNAHYDGEIRYMDTHVGQLLEGLRTHGLYDEAAVVLTSDHGEGLGQHGLAGHGGTWNEHLQVPLIVKLPAAMGRAGERRDDVVGLIDVMPTLAKALDLPLTEEERAQFAGADILSPTGRPGVLGQRTGKDRVHGDGSTYAYTAADWKYVHRTRGEDELYDLAADPSEQVDVLDDHPDVAARMMDALLSTLAAYEQTRRAVGEEGALPDDVIEALEELGYVR